MQKARNLILLAVMVLGFFMIPAQIANAATYSVNIVPISTPDADICLDDTCDDYVSLYGVDVDVVGRGTGSGNEIAVDVCFFVDTDIIMASAGVTATGTLYTGTYTSNNHYSCGDAAPYNSYPGSTTSGTGWKCGLILSDQMHCKLNIDDDTNARITITGRMDAPFECASDTPTWPVPTHNKFVQTDLYRHWDSTTLSATDSYTSAVSCLDDNGNTEVVPFLNLFYNGGGPPATYFKPANGVRIYDYGVWQPDGDIPGPITYRTVHTLPSWITITSCNITNHGSTWYSPLNPPTCVITGSGHTVTIDIKFGSDLLVEFEMTGNIGSIPECPSANQFTKDLITMDFMTRQYDGAWRFSQGWQVPFKCQ